jgi:hypothetical protein
MGRKWTEPHPPISAGPFPFVDLLSIQWPVRFVIGRQELDQSGGHKGGSRSDVSGSNILPIGQTAV